MTDTQAPTHTDAYLQLQTKIVAALDALATFPGFKQRNAQRHMIGDIARTMMTSGLGIPSWQLKRVRVQVKLMVIVCP